MNNSKNNRDISLEEMYKKIMSTSSSTNSVFFHWEKTGDVYKQYSIYDTSKYETMLSSSTVINK